MYRPPRLPFSEGDGDNTAKLCHMLKSLQGRVLVLGDFNLPGIDWQRLYSDSAGEKVVLDVIQSQFWTQHVEFATHCGGNILDLALSSSAELVHSVSDMGQLGDGDHRMLEVEVAGPALDRDSTELVPDWTKADMEGIKQAFASMDWEDALKDKCGVEAWDFLKEMIEVETEKHVPKKRRRVGSRPIWMNKNILKLIRKKRRLWRWYARDGGKDHASFIAYQNVQKEVKKGVTRAKRNLERKLAKNRKKNNKAFFSHIKKATSNRVSVGPLKQGDEVVADSGRMATMLNEFFSSVFTDEDTTSLPEVEKLFHGPDPLVSVEFLPSDVEKKLKKLKQSSAPGPDKLWPRVLHSLADVLSYPLALIFARCLSEGTVPPEWKRANITPIFKKGSKGSPGNYRPVSLTCILCKIMESLLRDSIVSHLAKHNLIHNTQHGFMSGRSCLTNLLEYLEELTKLMDTGKAVDIVYLDFAKAFDKVPIRRLLSKCSGLGIQGELLAWIGEWLTGREQRVVLNGEASGWEAVRSGVPQGSVLGPTLFLIFINDIDSAVNVTGSVLEKFADDTKWAMVVECEEDRVIFQQGLDRLMEWSLEWQMLFNVDKCHIIHAGHRNNLFEYSMGGRVLEEVDSEKDVGVLLHKSFRPSMQCAKAAKKANSVLGQLSRGVSFRDKDTFMGLFTTFVRPHLEYCSQAWSPWTLGDKEVLEAVQKRAVGMVTNLKGRSYEERLAEMGMVTLEERRRRGDLVQVYKVLTGKDNVDYTRWFELAHSRSGAASTRSTSGTLNVTRKEGKGEIRKNFWSVRVCDSWNSLPDSVKQQPSTNSFKNSLDNFNCGVKNRQPS